MTGEPAAGPPDPSPPEPDDVVVPHPFGRIAAAPRRPPAARDRGPGGAGGRRSRRPDAGRRRTPRPDRTADADGRRTRTADAEPGPTSRPDRRRPAAEPGPAPAGAEVAVRGSSAARDPLAAALIGVLTLLLGFAFAVQVRSTDVGTPATPAPARRTSSASSTTSTPRRTGCASRSPTSAAPSSSSPAPTASRPPPWRRPAAGGGDRHPQRHRSPPQGPGLRMTDPRPRTDEVRVADVLDAIQELRGAGAETMQIDGVRVGVSTAVTGDPATS
jgi:hypothetical protein